MRRLALAFALGAWLAAAPAAADDGPEFAGWKQRLDAAQAEIASARERAATALEAYQHMRRDRSTRGEEKSKIIAERARTEHAVHDAEARLESLREQARRAGVPARDLLPEPPADSGPDS